MSESKPVTTRKYKLIVGDLPSTPQTKTEQRPEPPVEVDGWRQAARGSKPGDRYCRPNGSRKRKPGKSVRTAVTGESQTTWTRFRAWLDAHRP